MLISGPTSYFLLVHHLDSWDVHVEEFGADERAAAEAYNTREHEYRDEPTVKFVMLSRAIGRFGSR